MSIIDAVNTAVTNYSEEEDCEGEFKSKSRPKPGSKANKRTRGYTFTDYDVTANGINYLISVGSTVGQIIPGSTTPLLHKDIKCEIEYMIYAIEICPTTNRQHFQGFIYFKNPQPLSSVIEKLKPRHIEAMAPKSTAKYNREYILKGNHVTSIDYSLYKTGAPGYGVNVQVYKYGSVTNPSYDVCCAHEYGDYPRQGERNDLKTIHEMIITGEISTELQLTKANSQLYCQYSRPLKRIMELNVKPRNTMPRVYIAWGDSGSGKSYYANNNGYKPVILSGAYDNPFVSNYNGEAKILLDEFDYKSVSHSWIFKLCDRYEFVFNTKGGYQQCLVTDIIFTSNINPKLWWPDLPESESKTAFYRRITGIEHVVRSETTPAITLPVLSDVQYEGLNTKTVTRLETNLYQMTMADMQAIIDELASVKKQNQEYVHILSQRT